MNARDARELADRATKETVNAEVHYIFGEIRKTASIGKNAMTIMAKHVSKETASHLSVLGYSVEFKPDQRDGDYYSIRW